MKPAYILKLCSTVIHIKVRQALCADALTIGLANLSSSKTSPCSCANLVAAKLSLVWNCRGGARSIKLRDYMGQGENCMTQRAHS